MTFIDWLSSPIGVDLVHAAIVFLLAAASWLTYLTHRQTTDNARKLNAHLEQHVLDAVERSQSAPVTPAEPPPGANP